MSDIGSLAESTPLKTPFELAQLIAKYEDAESAIMIYKEARSAIAQYEEVATAAKACAEADLSITGEAKRTTAMGSCGWQKPKTPKLDKDAWTKALASDKKLSKAQNAFDDARNKIKQLQEPYMVLSDRGAFYIR